MKTKLQGPPREEAPEHFRTQSKDKDVPQFTSSMMAICLLALFPSHPWAEQGFLKNKLACIQPPPAPHFIQTWRPGILSTEAFLLSLIACTAPLMASTPAGPFPGAASLLGASALLLCESPPSLPGRVPLWHLAQHTERIVCLSRPGAPSRVDTESYSSL